MGRSFVGGLGPEIGSQVTRWWALQFSSRPQPPVTWAGGLGGGGGGTRPWWLALLACGGAYWPLAFEPSAMTRRHPYYWGGGVSQVFSLFHSGHFEESQNG